jgi:urease accessory protein
VNEVLHNEKRIAKDAMLLDKEELGDLLPNRSLRDRLQPYSCYAMLILFGPEVQSIIAAINARYDKISIFKAKTPAPLIWSLSTIDSTYQGVVIRVAGIETETVKGWLREALSGLEPIIGTDVYRRTFP